VQVLFTTAKQPAALVAKGKSFQRIGEQNLSLVLLN